MPHLFEASQLDATICRVCTAGRDHENHRMGSIPNISDDTAQREHVDALLIVAIQVYAKTGDVRQLVGEISRRFSDGPHRVDGEHRH